MLTSALAETHLHRPFAVSSHRKPESSKPRPIGLVMSFGRNAEIYAEGETSGYVYKVLSGVVRVSKLLPDGRRQISAFHMPGEMFGFEANEIHLPRPKPWSPPRLLPLNGKACGHHKQSASFVRELLSLAVLGFRHTQDHLLLLGRKNALERLAEFLLEMDARMGGTTLSSLPCRDMTSLTISG